ncbi:MAG: hypothetical protein HRT74_12875 [Flavobacteriales bacterium]|nr:hypothetical protein [Flavobacteriales bacterium]
MKQREDYQPEAVLAAEEILKSRDVSELEEFELNQEADELLVAERESLHSKEVGLSLFVNRVTEVLSKWGPIHEETPKPKVVGWGVMVLLIMDFIYSCVDYKECIGAEFYVEAWEYCLKSFATEIVGIPISLYLLARR